MSFLSRIFKKEPQERNIAVIVAAGDSKRMQADRNKILEEINEMPVIASALSAFELCRAVSGIVLVARKDEIPYMWDLIRKFEITKAKSVVAGGKTRTESVLNGLSELSPGDFAVIHDGARPFISAIDIERVIEAARECGAAALGVPVRDTVKRVDRDFNILETVSREDLWLVQTPQVFPAGKIREALLELGEEALTDECAAFERKGSPVRMVEGSLLNFKITVREDLEIARMMKRGEEELS